MLELLVVLPIIHFLIMYMVSRYRGTLQHLWHLYAITILDWVFVPFNFLIAYSVNFSLILFVIFIILSVIPVIILHTKWKDMKKKPKETKYLTTQTGLTIEGWIHFIFMMIQIALVSTFIFSKAIYPYYLWSMLCIFIYLIGYILFIVFVRKVRLRSKAEIPYIIASFIIIIIRLLIKY